MCKDCKTCVHLPICEYCAENTDFKFPQEDGICALFNPVKEVQPLTKADQLRNMSNEELAKELAMIAGWDRKEYSKAVKIGLKKVMLDWLGQPVEDTEDDK